MRKLKEFIKDESNLRCSYIIVVFFLILTIWAVSVCANIYIIKWLLVLIIISYNAVVYLTSKAMLSKLFAEEKINYSIKEVEKKYNVYISIIPELYKDGVNWNWQILWYEKGKIEGTYMFGDNNEHPSRENAEKAAIDYLMILNNKGRNEEGDKEAMKIYRETYE